MGQTQLMGKLGIFVFLTSITRNNKFNLSPPNNDIRKNYFPNNFTALLERVIREVPKRLT